MAYGKRTTAMPELRKLVPAYILTIRVAPSVKLQGASKLESREDSSRALPHTIRSGLLPPVIVPVQ